MSVSRKEDGRVQWVELAADLHRTAVEGGALYKFTNQFGEESIAFAPWPVVQAPPAYVPAPRYGGVGIGGIPVPGIPNGDNQWPVPGPYSPNPIYVSGAAVGMN